MSISPTFGKNGVALHRSNSIPSFQSLKLGNGWSILQKIKKLKINFNLFHSFALSKELLVLSSIQYIYIYIY